MVPRKSINTAIFKQHMTEYLKYEIHHNVASEYFNLAVKCAEIYAGDLVNVNRARKRKMPPIDVLCAAKKSRYVLWL